MSWEVRGFSDAGQLDHTITLLRFTQSTNDYGEVIYTWTPYAQDWAELVPLSTSEKLQAAQVQTAVDVALRIRWREDVTAQLRVEIDGHQYELVGPPQEVGRHRFLDLLARRRDPGQPARAMLEAED
jgi:SPP1 family predicted phage head-tail adaptor